jgi:hypothetical protein
MTQDSDSTHQSPCVEGGRGHPAPVDSCVKITPVYGRITMNMERGLPVFRTYDESGRLVKVTQGEWLGVMR